MRRRMSIPRTRRTKTKSTMTTRMIPTRMTCRARQSAPRGQPCSIDGPPRHMIADIPSMRSRITEVAKKFLEAHETEKQGKSMKKKASKILANLSGLAAEIEAFYLHRTSPNLAPASGTELFAQLASYFDSDVLGKRDKCGAACVRSCSGPRRSLEQSGRGVGCDGPICVPPGVYGILRQVEAQDSHRGFAHHPLSVMIHKLQDLLSRSEHFEVITVHQNTFDGNRISAASMLAKQIRLKLVADEDSDIPRAYRNIMVTIHAITTFKSLDDYLRPRITLSERPRVSRRSEAASRSFGCHGRFYGSPLSAAAAARLVERPPPPSGNATPPLPPSHRHRRPARGRPASPSPSSDLVRCPGYLRNHRTRERRRFFVGQAGDKRHPKRRLLRVPRMMKMIWEIPSSVRMRSSSLTMTKT